MLKLLIVDDERIIRETMATIIDWNTLDIQLIGTAKDGIEAYNIILDEYPDIVLTDIKMPALSGIELIAKIHEINPQTQFIILSGYGEFEYAKKAMQYGVKHYLLKPCNEMQIVDSIKNIKKDYFQNITHFMKEDPETNINVFHSIGVSIFTSCLSLPSDTCAFQNIIKTYSKYLDVQTTPYTLYYVYYTPSDGYLEIIQQLSHFKTQYFPGLLIQSLYVKNTLIFYYPSDNIDTQIMEQFFTEISEVKEISSEYKSLSFSNLSDMLQELVPHIKRYDSIYYTSNIDTNIFTTLNNYQNIIKETQDLISEIFSDDKMQYQTHLISLMSLLSSVSNLDFFKQLATSVTITAISKSRTFDMEEISNFLIYIEHEDSSSEIRRQLELHIEHCYNHYLSGSTTISLSSKIKQIVEQHYGNPNLSLKWISENCLFMNVDYLSKRFLKETGNKFSKYLIDYRIFKAKQIMATSGTDYSIQQIAGLIGCGNNPQYFSQIFKKSTGITPSKYMKTLYSRQESNDI